MSGVSFYVVNMLDLIAHIRSSICSAQNFDITEFRCMDTLRSAEDIEIAVEKDLCAILSMIQALSSSCCH